MFQYIIQGRYALTILLVASIVGYIVYYGLEGFAQRSAQRRINKAVVAEEKMATEEKENAAGDHGENAGEAEEMESSLDDEDVIIIEEEIIVSDNTDEETIDIEALIADIPEESKSDSEIFSVKKHKVKNIAEGVSREDILQDKHDKSLQKVKYEAVLCKQRNDLAGYEKKLIEGLILDPDDVDIFRQLADFYFSEGKYTKALSMFRKILTFDPNDHHALRQIGEIYIEQGQYEDAQVFIEKALALSPDNPKYYISLIDISIARDDVPSALTYLEKIVGLRPRNISYLMALGEMYEKVGRSEDAKQTYFRVLEIDPLHIDVKHILKRF